MFEFYISRQRYGQEYYQPRKNKKKIFFILLTISRLSHFLGRLVRPDRAVARLPAKKISARQIAP